MKLLLRATSCLLCFAACSSQYPFLTRAESVKAGILKNDCVKHNVTSANIAVADSLHGLATSLMNNGKSKQAYSFMYIATVYYRIAMAKHGYEETSRQIATLESSIAQAKEQLATYSRVLDELNGQ
ncbi:MAG: hypothetical protein GF398_01915 [Chitinivibrionales bacterium]|nr:hypothetical protein [Chitinivibrionales bacterium]